MARPKQELIRLLEIMSEEERDRLEEQFVEPQVRELREERKSLQNRLQTVEKELARLEGKAKRGPRRGGKPALDVRRGIATKRQPARRRRGRGGKETLADAIERILRSAGKPMRVKDICDALVHEGQARTKGLASYVSRVLASNPQFVKADWGEYALDKTKIKASPKEAAKKRGRKSAKKTARKSNRGKKKSSAKKKAGRKKRGALTRKAKALPKK